MVMDLENAAQGKEMAVKLVVKLVLGEVHCGYCVDLAQAFALSLFLFLNFGISLLKRCLRCYRLAYSCSQKQTHLKGYVEERI